MHVAHVPNAQHFGSLLFSFRALAALHMTELDLRPVGSHSDESGLAAMRQALDLLQAVGRLDNNERVFPNHDARE